MYWKMPSHTVLYCMRCASIFLKSLPIVFSGTIRQNIFGVLWHGFPSLGIMTDTDSLKQVGQWPREIQAFPTKKRVLAQSSSKIRTLRCLQVRWSGPGAEVLEHASRESHSSFRVKGVHSHRGEEEM
jgi:hypothetical protein